MRVCYTPDYFVELPEGHPFPMGKFPEFYRILSDEGLLAPGQTKSPGEASWEMLHLVHTQGYLEQLRLGKLDRRAQRRMGLPWSAALVRRSRLAVQGTLEASRMALEDGIAANLAGGTHHAFPDFGEGFCVLNDVAVAVRQLMAEGRIARSLIIDLDVHQGNGTAVCLAGVPSAFTFSVHGEKNFPFKKERSSRDVALPDGTGDEQYLYLLSTHLPQVLAAAQPELVFYLAGVDLVEGDRYGRIALSRDGLAARERLVLQAVHQRGIPLVLLMSGGYAPTPFATADLHAVVHRQARGIYCA